MKEDLKPGGSYLFISVVTGIIGMHYLWIAIQSYIEYEYKGGKNSGDPMGVGLGLIFSIPFFAAAVPCGFLAWKSRKAASAKRSKEKKP